MPNKAQPVGQSQAFVLSQGFCQAGRFWGLMGSDGSTRLLAEITADPDRPDVRPLEAYQSMLSSMQPGWVVRLLQLFWPDPAPRARFQQQAQAWHANSDGVALLQQSLLLFSQSAPLPFGRRTFLEFVLPGDEGLAWWEGLPGLWQPFGLRLSPLSADELGQLAHQIFNPALG